MREMSAGFLNLHANPKLGHFPAHNSDRAVSWPRGQILTGLTRRLAVSVALVAAGILVSAGCRSNTSTGSVAPAGSAASTSGVPRGGELTASVRSEPQSFNRHAAR